MRLKLSEGELKGLMVGLERAAFMCDERAKGHDEKGTASAMDQAMECRACAEEIRMLAYAIDSTRPRNGGRKDEA